MYCRASAAESRNNETVTENGEHGASSLWGKHNDGKPMQYAVHDGTKARLVRTTPMFDEIGGDY